MGSIVCPHDCIFDQIGVAAGGDFDPRGVVERQFGQYDRGSGAGPARLGPRDTGADWYDRKQRGARLGDFGMEDAVGGVGLWVRDLFAFPARASRLAGRTRDAPRRGKIPRHERLVAIDRRQLLPSLPGADCGGQDTLRRSIGRDQRARRGQCRSPCRLDFGRAVVGGRSKNRNRLCHRAVSGGSGRADGYAAVARGDNLCPAAARADQPGATTGFRGAARVQDQRARCFRSRGGDAGARHGGCGLAGRSGELVPQHRRIDERAHHAGAAPCPDERTCRPGRMVRGAVDQRARRRERRASRTCL